MSHQKHYPSSCILPFLHHAAWPTAGQTVPHLHMHLIPRFQVDVPDARGGVRWVIADKAKYWGD